MSTGYLHRALTQSLLAHLPATLHHQVESWMEPAALVLAPKDEGNGLRLAHFIYTSAIHMEDVPFALVDTASLFAQVGAWVMEHDSDRDMLSPEEQQIRIDTNKVDDNKIDIDIDVMLCEAMHLIPDTQGPVLLDNRRWRLDVPPLYVAEGIQVVTELDTQTGAGYGK